MLKTFIFPVALLMFISCKKNDCTPGISSCMQTQIDSSLAKPKGSHYQRIDAYKYQGNNVYLYFTGCCDRFNELKDEDCKYLFAPSGGFGGGGDGTHPNFRNEATFISTVWVDPRP
jgi:hypothetical protein